MEMVFTYDQIGCFYLDSRFRLAFFSFYVSEENYGQNQNIDWNNSCVNVWRRENTWENRRCQKHENK